MFSGIQALPAVRADRMPACSEIQRPSNLFSSRGFRPLPKVELWLNHSTSVDLGLGLWSISRWQDAVRIQISRNRAWLSKGILADLLQKG